MFDETPVHDSPLLQDPAFAAALRLCGQSPIHLPSGPILLDQRLWGLRFLMLPRAVPPPDLGAQLRHCGISRRPLILSPERPCVLPPAVGLQAARLRASLDLSGDAANLRSRLHPKWRNQLNKAEKQDIAVRHHPFDAARDHWVLQAEQYQARARRYANWPPALTAAFAQVAPRQTRLYVARHKGQNIAQMLFLTHGACVTYHIGLTTAAGKVVAAHNLLLWRAACDFAALGMRTLDLGVLSPHRPALNRFKLRSGAEALETGGTHLYWRPLARC